MLCYNCKEMKPCIIRGIAISFLYNKLLRLFIDHKMLKIELTKKVNVNITTITNIRISSFIFNFNNLDCICLLLDYKINNIVNFIK